MIIILSHNIDIIYCYMPTYMATYMQLVLLNVLTINILLIYYYYIKLLLFIYNLLLLNYYT